jgi:hypothetical protein
MKKIKLPQEVINVLESHDFNMADITEQDGEYYLDFGQYTPEGEDWGECVWFDGTAESFVEAVQALAESFDIDEEVEPYISMRGQRGVPSSISALVEDAKWKQKKLTDLSDALNALDLEEEEEEDE